MTLRSSPTVFVIDDDVEVRASIQSLLKAAGFHSESFGTAEEFLQIEISDWLSCLVLEVFFLESTAWSFSGNLQAPAYAIPSSSLPATVSFR